MTSIDEYVQKGAKTSFEDIRTQRQIVDGHAPIPAAPARAFIPRRAGLAHKDFDNFGYTEVCRGCEFLQTWIGQRQNHSDQCRDRLEAELAKSEEGQVRLERSKDRINHWTAKVGEDVLAGEVVENNVEQERSGGVIDEDKEMKHPEEFDTSGSLTKVLVPEEEIELSSRGVAPSERRIGTPERTPATKRRPTTDHKNSPPERLVMDPEDNMNSDDVEIDVAMTGRRDAVRGGVRCRRRQWPGLDDGHVY